MFTSFITPFPIYQHDCKFPPVGMCIVNNPDPDVMNMTE